MTPGSVFLYKDFVFPDGIKKPKLLLALAPCTDGRVLCVLTTSQQHQHPLRDGCHSDAKEPVFTFNAHLGGFEKTTWIILQPKLMTEKGLKNRFESGDCKSIIELCDTDLKAVINCLKKIEDISPYQLSLLPK